jgi:hypothetical protein
MLAIFLVALVGQATGYPPAAMPLPYAMWGVGCRNATTAEACLARCDCEWCVPTDARHGCHPQDLEGPCGGGKSGQRRPHDECYGAEDEGRERTEGIVVGVLFVGGAALALLWRVARRVPSRGDLCRPCCCCCCCCRRHGGRDDPSSVDPVLPDAREGDDRDSGIVDDGDAVV